MTNFLGKKGENIGAKYLKEKGYLIKERNFRRKWGEIDIVAYDRKTKEIVFLEVKTISLKKNISPLVLPEEGLTEKKRKRLKKAILSYLSQDNLDNKPWRFDFIAIEIDKFTAKTNIRHYKNIFLEF
ncbi:MAG: YraN family protein [Minisyncoccia bacterium]